MLIYTLTRGKIFPQMPVYENNDKIWENFFILAPILIKFSHFLKPYIPYEKTASQRTPKFFIKAAMLL